MFRRSTLPILALAISGTPLWLDRLHAFAWALVVHGGALSRHASSPVPAVAVWPPIGGNANANVHAHRKGRSRMCNRSSNRCGNGNAGPLHSSVASPYRDVGGSVEDGSEGQSEKDAPGEQESLFQSREKDPGAQGEALSELCLLLGAERGGLLRLGADKTTGLRGLYLGRSVRSGAALLEVPLSSCLRDDAPPSWLPEAARKDPHAWATRLAAGLADLALRNPAERTQDEERTERERERETKAPQGETERAQKLWWSLLPDQEHLGASLPVHWLEATVLSARSTALEIAVDSAFFARAEAVDDLVKGLEQSPYAERWKGSGSGTSSGTSAKELAHHVLDLVQTRSCRLEEGGGSGEDLGRALVPVFDFLNHGSRRAGDANASFSVEEGGSNRGKRLVVRATKDIAEGSEARIDYGASARPAWRCLHSYGFVSDYKRTVPAKEGETGQRNDRDNNSNNNGRERDEDAPDNLAEVYMKGVRYEVTDDSIPADMVADASPLEWVGVDADGLAVGEAPSPPVIVLTPTIASRIADRIADAAYYLLLEPEQILDGDEGSSIPPTPFEVISHQLAARLRWTQHRILLSCAAGLTQFAKEEESRFR
ncbi:unnamed protein product [Pseudo-nitzschia multistriata]|uniref:SET domain-containing protein n=1 Tax=Pseudo-nitzschia multistriata TaxID=183589 RepID=A0A448Z1A7_9STRA|nr:unnamed protein product [Pseudo-nitzschia multistriata]